MDRREFIAAVGVTGAIGLAGCSGGPSGDGDGGSTETTTSGGDGGDGEEMTETEMGTETATPADPTQIGMVYATGGLGDGSFNDQAQQGLMQAKEELDIESQAAQPGQVSEFKTFQSQFAQSTDPAFDLICCIGFLQTDALKQTSKSFPDQNFMIVDSVVDNPNVASYVFKEHEGSFLVGQLAGLLTGRDFQAGAGSTNPDSTKVGFVGGVESDLIRKFQAGYEAGVKKGNADAEILTNYTGSFNDPAAGKTAANAMFNNGADIIYHASGNTGTGVFQAAQEKGRFAIGVDRDQSVTKSSYANVILASMIKRVDTAVFNAIESVTNDSFEGGTVTALGLAEDGHDIVYGQGIGDDIPGDVKDAISQSEQGIIDGSISVPTDPANV